MQCSEPPPITDDQISAAIDGTAEAGVLDHLARCTSCARRFQQAQQLEQGLHRRLLRWDCPAPLELADYQLRRASPGEARAIELHLAGCARCRDELADLGAFMAADFTTEDAPPALMPQRDSRAGPWFVRPHMQPPAVALRGAGAGPLMASAGDTTIFLDLQPAAGGLLALQGQIVDADQERWAGALVELRQAGALAATAEVGDLGDFVCPALPPGASELRVAPQAGRMIVLTDLDLKL